jgi:hypothetical protein
MVTSAESGIHTLEIVKSSEIAAPADIVFETVLDLIGPESEMPDGTPFPMKIEPWPGGRWYRDLGNSSGHYWGHVQVIKPPALIEICVPLFMSFPVVSHVQYRLVACDVGTRLTITHRALGLIPADIRAQEGWEFQIQRVRKVAEERQRGASGK